MQVVDQVHSDKTQMIRHSGHHKRRYRVRRILVSRLRFMGDIILTTPLISALKNTFPRAEIDYLAEQPYIELLRHHPFIEQRICFDRNVVSQFKPVPGIKYQWQLIRHLRGRKYDLAIDLLGIPYTAFLLVCAAAPIRVGGCFRYRSHLYTHCFDPSKGWHSSIDFHLLVLDRLGIQIKAAKPQLFLTENERQWAKEYLREKGINRKRKIVGIHPGGTWPAKLWPMDRFTELANRLVEKDNTDVFVTFGPDDQSLITRMRPAFHQNVMVGDQLNLRQLTAVIDRFSVYVSNDCGPMHIGPAVNTPTIGIFGPSEPEIWFPYSREDGHKVLYKLIHCRPCHQHECPDQHQCMDWVSVEDVLREIRIVLDRAAS